MTNPQASYWEGRYQEEGEIWGENPCGAAVEAAEICKSLGLSKVLVPGCGYGRNARCLARQGLGVTGFDISPWAVEKARQEAAAQVLRIEYSVADILHPPSITGSFDGIFTFNLLHLFGREDRSAVASWFRETLRQGGLLILTSMSLNDPDFAKGEEVDRHTFESKKGRPVFYFDEADMRSLLTQGWEIVALKEVQEKENHGGKEHSHCMWMVTARKK